jgi:hypothetical protein
MQHPNIIKNAMTVKHSSERQIMDGVVKGSLNAFQKSATKGLLANAGEPVRKPTNKSTVKAHGKEPKTKGTDGYMPYPGAK